MDIAAGKLQQSPTRRKTPVFAGHHDNPVERPAMQINERVRFQGQVAEPAGQGKDIDQRPRPSDEEGRDDGGQKLQVLLAENALHGAGIDPP